MTRPFAASWNSEPSPGTHSTPHFIAESLFEGSGGEVTYLGEMTLDQMNPWYTATAPETGRGPLRNVIMFRLVPVGPIARQAGAAAEGVSGPTLNTPYVDVDDTTGVDAISPAAANPDIVDRGVKGHKRTQNAVAAWVRAQGMSPHRPGPGDPGFDLGGGTETGLWCAR